VGTGGASLDYEGMLQTPRLREGIEGLYRSSMGRRLNSNPQDDLAFDGTYGWIQAIAQAEHDLAPYLDLWLRAHRLMRIDTSR